MRGIEPQVTEEISRLLGTRTVDSVDAFPVRTFRELVQHTARLSYLNKDYLLFFRGQASDYRNKAGSSTFYPSIYRGDPLTRSELAHRFELLDSCARELRRVFADEAVLGHTEVARKKYIQWGILQHYEVCSTPMLDLTHSLRVACSFAHIASNGVQAYVMVFALPYLTNRISTNSEHDIVTVRLLSICPPDALRPYFQEGYLSATEDITSEYDSKTELDFKNRLVAKFLIAAEGSFWGSDFTMIPRAALYPPNDRIQAFCDEIKLRAPELLLPGRLGEFLKEWSDLESALVQRAEAWKPRAYSSSGAISALAASGDISEQIAYELHGLRKFRNAVVHEPRLIEPSELEKRLSQLRHLRSRLP
jgi:hypothetical protein